MSSVTYKFSDDAREYLRDYHGSIDSTAILLAFDAGSSHLAARVKYMEAVLRSIINNSHPESTIAGMAERALSGLEGYAEVAP